MTNAERARRGLTTEAYCPACGNNAETITHDLRGCPTTQVIPQNLTGSFFSLNLDWLNSNMKSSVMMKDDAYSWRHFFWNHALEIVETAMQSCLLSSVSQNTLEAGGCGILRNFDRDWLAGYCRSLGRCSIFHDELWALVDGLKVAWIYGFRRIEVEMDNKVAIRILSSPSSPCEPTLVRHI
ncbi:hypothetical protein F3Y22_tig00111099pilonHSYRG00150 [Hibiscus syriacus]|uniref:RNase H type-1 domain-containing protein n=1 Tax=Hibiscus syriacus TaxID=106335 RepID=A0A6A2Z2K3_HIBSY|nr:hypothetical protein F3Y22_tig00111099pilonHSYRG00150 [Hibiscus syriacus]